MLQTIKIQKIAVLGAGVMGAQIAAHCANAGFEVLLYDLADGEKNQENDLIIKAITNLNKLKPAPLGGEFIAQLIKAKNYTTNLQDLISCDLIIEAVAERLDIKEKLYGSIIPYIRDSAVLVSNTSGLSINELSSVLPDSLQKRFCGMHFFNPPRYMHLVELIPSNQTSTLLLDILEVWLTQHLGKGVVRAKDTPNYIANRIGVFSLLSTLNNAYDYGVQPDEVDALTGTLIGRPKSATYRTMDVVGLDTLQHVVQTMKDKLTDDPWHQLFQLPDWLTSLISAGQLGQKSGAGIYRKNQEEKKIEVFDTNTYQYRTANATVSSELSNILKNPNDGKKIIALMQSSHPQAQFLAACFRDLFQYCAYHLSSIADSVWHIDAAMEWGFGWQKGPFKLWQEAGVEQIKQFISSNSISLPTWLQKVDQFYSNDKAFYPKKSDYQLTETLAVYDRQRINLSKVLYENEGVILKAYEHNSAVLSFKSKSNTFNQAVLDGIESALNIAEKQCSGMIIYQQDDNNFSSGANLKEVAEFLTENNLDAVTSMVEQFQQVMMRLKYAAIPVIAGLRGRALGGGCELALHCHRIVAAFESYPGLVEIGVGLLPAGGGCKELALRAAHRAGEQELLPFLQSSFKQIAMAYVANSAADAKSHHYLQADDIWVMNRNEVLFASLSILKSLIDCNYKAPPASLFKVAGREGAASLQAGLVNWLEGQFISQHDYHIASCIAHVLCGGDVNVGQLVSEEWILKLEREAFIELAASPLTQARIQHILKTGKALRN